MIHHLLCQKSSVVYILLSFVFVVLIHERIGANNQTRIIQIIQLLLTFQLEKYETKLFVVARFCCYSTVLYLLVESKKLYAIFFLFACLFVWGCFYSKLFIKVTVYNKVIQTALSSLRRFQNLPGTNVIRRTPTPESFKSQERPATQNGTTR